MTDNHPAVDKIIMNIPKDAEFGQNKIRGYNQVFSALQNHGYTDAIDQLRGQIISETRDHEHHNLPAIKTVCQMVVSLTGVDTDLEDDLPRNF